jgi:pimeloyl-ACP methyl ester carboxylesterase
VSEAFSERAVTFGPERGMVGILAQPAGGEPSPLGVLLLNAGVIHRVGPNRINVLMARAIAELGLTTLRFDQSGLGDSAPRQDTTDLRRSVELDMDAAMDYMIESHGCERFLIIGICSGARLALQTAYRDERVAAIAVIDPPSYKTAKAMVSHYGPRLLKAESWRTALSGKNQRIKGALDRIRGRDKDQDADAAAPAPASTMPGRLPEWPSREDMGQALERLVGQGTRMYWIYTAGVSDYQYNYRDQIRDVFPEACASSVMEWELMSESDHDFPDEASRRKLLDLLRNWLRRAELVR